MSTGVVPIARALYLCDYHIESARHKVDLYGIFNAIAPASYPHTQRQFCVFAQLTGGQGQVPFFVDIVFASQNELVHTTAPRHLTFRHRTELVQLALALDECSFPRPGMYLVELYCDNTWVADAPLLLR